MNTRMCALALMLFNTTLLFAKSEISGGGVIGIGVLVAIIAFPLGCSLAKSEGDIASFLGAIFCGIGLLGMLPLGAILLWAICTIASAIIQVGAIIFAIFLVFMFIRLLFGRK